MLEMTGTIQNWTGFKFFRKLRFTPLFRLPHTVFYTFVFREKNLLHKQNVLFFGPPCTKKFSSQCYKIILIRILTKKLVTRIDDVSEEPFLGIFSKSAALK